MLILQFTKCHICPVVISYDKVKSGMTAQELFFVTIIRDSWMNFFLLVGTLIKMNESNIAV